MFLQKIMESCIQVEYISWSWCHLSDTYPIVKWGCCRGMVKLCKMSRVLLIAVGPIFALLFCLLGRGPFVTVRRCRSFHTSRWRCLLFLWWKIFCDGWTSRGWQLRWTCLFLHGSGTGCQNKSCRFPINNVSISKQTSMLFGLRLKCVDRQ